MRIGLIVQKLGMSRVLTDEGEHVPVTLLKFEKTFVTNIKTVADHGYNAVQVGTGEIKSNKVSKPLRGHFAKLNIEPRKNLVEFRVIDDSGLNIGDQISLDHFVAGQKVDVIGTSHGKGFAGVMKRHNFSGHRASHGASIAHRTQGSTGSCQDPGRVFKNKKMAGHLGAARVTIQNLVVHAVDHELNLIIVKGAVPGHKGSQVLIKDAIKWKGNDTLPFPAAIIKSSQQSDIENINVESIEI